MRDDELWRAYCASVQPLTKRPRASRSAPFQFVAHPGSAAPGYADLHGMTLDAAHALVRRMLDERSDRRSITVVTGKSGAIRREFLHWIDGHAAVSRIEELRGGGAFRLHFKRRSRRGRNDPSGE